MMHAIDPELQSTIEEVARINDDVRKVLDLITEQIAQVDEASGQMFKAAGSLARASNSNAGNQFGVVLGETAAVIAVAGLAIQGAGWLWGKAKRAWTLATILPKKQAIAEAKQGEIERMLPRIERCFQKVDLLLQRSAADAIAPSTTERLTPLWAGMNSLAHTYLRTRVLLLQCEWVLGEFEAWLNGQHESGALPPNEFAVIDETYLKLLSHANVASLGDGIATPITLGAIYTAHHDSPSEFLKQSPEYRTLISTLASRRLRSVLLPFGERARAERHLYGVCLRGATSVAKRVQTVVLSTTLAGAASVGAYATAVTMGYLPDPSASTTGVVAASMTGVTEATDHATAATEATSACHGAPANTCYAEALSLAQDRIDQSGARDRLSAACDVRHAGACRELASLRCRMASGPRDREDATLYFSRACTLGATDACGRRCD